MAKRTLPIEFPSLSHTVEHGDGVDIHWTARRTTNEHNFRWVCATVEGTRPICKRMVKYEREEKS